MKDEVIKNPERQEQSAAEHYKYVPQYVAHSIEPKKVNFANREEPLDSIVDDLNDNSSEVNLLGMNIPNVGNNEEQLWAKNIINENISNLDNYVIIINNEIFFVGTLNDVEKEIRSIFYGEHPICKSDNITIDDVIVLKKMKIKIGVFVE